MWDLLNLKCWFYGALLLYQWCDVLNLMTLKTLKYFTNIVLRRMYLGFRSQHKSDLCWPGYVFSNGLKKQRHTVVNLVRTYPRICIIRVCVFESCESVVLQKTYDTSRPMSYLEPVPPWFQETLQWVYHVSVSKLSSTVLMETQKTVSLIRCSSRFRSVRSERSLLNPVLTFAVWSTRIFSRTRI